MLLLAEQLQRLLVPVGSGVITAEDGSVPARFVRNTEGEVALDQPLQRFGRMRGGLIFVDDVAKTIGGGEPLARTLIVAADLHLLASEMVVDQVELQPRVGRVARIRVAADQ